MASAQVTIRNGKQVIELPDSLMIVGDQVEVRETACGLLLLGTAPTQSAELESAITASESIAELPYGWDGEEASAIDRRTWQRATDFLRHANTVAMQSTGEALEVPDIAPCADGSIDLWWQKGGAYRLLVNVPAGSAKASYYGDNFTDGLTFKGAFDIEALNLPMIYWLAGMRKPRV